MYWRLTGHHVLSHGNLTHHPTGLHWLALDHHLPRLLSHHLSGLLSHHLRLLNHHLPRLLSHHRTLLTCHHLTRLLLLRHHLPHDLALHHLHLLAGRPHLHPGTHRPHEPAAGDHLHGLSLDRRSHADHVGLRGALPVLGGHVAGAGRH